MTVVTTKPEPIEKGEPDPSTTTTRKRKQSRLAIGAAILAPFVILSILTSYFWLQYRNNEQLDSYPFTWHYHWITSPATPTNHMVCFRKIIDAPAVFKYAYVAVNGDNFYDFRINGAIVRTAFHDSQSSTLLKRQTTYSALGYARNGEKPARLYNIERFLRPGPNLLSVLVQSDEDKVEVAVQGAIVGTQRMDFGTDSTWTCSPTEQLQDETPWTSLRFIDTGWPRAKQLDTYPVPYCDGDLSIVDTPWKGQYIGTATPVGTDTILTKTFYAPGPETNGWLRLSHFTPYDMSLNGVLIGSSGTIARFAGGFIGKRNVYDVFKRLQYNTGRPTLLVQNPHADIYEFKNRLLPGANTLTLVLHHDPTLSPDDLPAIRMDGLFTYPNGSSSVVQTDTSWTATSADGSSVPIRVAALPSVLDPTLSRLHFASKENSGFRRYLQTTKFAIIFFVFYLVMTWLLTRVVNSLIQKKEAKSDHSTVHDREYPSGGLATGTSATIATMRSAAILTAFPIILLGLCICVQTIYFNSVESIYFNDTTFAIDALIVSLGLWVVVALCGAAWAVHNAGAQKVSWPVVGVSKVTRTDSTEHAGSSTRDFIEKWWATAAVLGISITSFAYYYNGIAVDSYLPDEYISLMAAKGIIHHGIPLYPETGIIYTRSSLFHYLLALFMIVGHSTTDYHVTRLLPALWQVAIVPVTYLLGREMKGKAAGVLAAAMVAYSPFFICYAREARFYSQFAFFSGLTFYFLIRSVRMPDKPLYGLGATLAFSGCYLSHQLAVAIVPAAIMVIVYSRQTRLWFRGVRLFGALFALFVMVADLYAYLKYCVTPLPFVDSDSASLVAFHTDYLDLLPSMLLISVERTHAVLGALYFAGLGVLIVRLFTKPKGIADVSRAGWTWWNYMYLTSLTVIIVTTLITPRPANRYGFSAVPLIAVTAACAAVEFGQYLGRLTQGLKTNAAWGRAVQWSFAICLCLLIGISYRPVRAWDATTRHNNVDHAATARYVAAHWKPGDILLFNSPQTAEMELGSCDFYWRKSSSIFCYIGHDGILRNRDTGAPLIDNVDKLRMLTENHNRIWVVLPQWQVTIKGKNADFAAFLTQNFQIVDEPLGLTVLLWDKSRGHYKDGLPNTNELFNY